MPTEEDIQTSSHDFNYGKLYFSHKWILLESQELYMLQQSIYQAI